MQPHCHAKTMQCPLRCCIHYNLSGLSPGQHCNTTHDKMGKGTDKLYITHSEWASSDAYSASVGAGAGSRAQRPAGANFRRLPFNFCAASLQPFKNPVCTPEGTIFDVEVISTWLQKHDTNPVNGKPLDAKDLIKLNFARNADTDIDPNAGPTDGKGDMSKCILIKTMPRARNHESSLNCT